MTNYIGIDYGRGETNIDKQTGIRFGVINQGEVGQAWFESAEADYGKPTCPKCGNEAIELAAQTTQLENGVLVEPIIPENMEEWEYAEHECADYACEHCEYVFGSESAFGAEPNGFYFEDGEYKAFQFGDGDIFVEKSPYFTYAQFCSPCAPGAVYLMEPLDPISTYPAGAHDKCGQPLENNRGYCFGHDWFWDTESKKAPYPVYSIETGKLVEN